jgi:hypothetical protein
MCHMRCSTAYCRPKVAPVTPLHASCHPRWKSFDPPAYQADTKWSSSQTEQCMSWRRPLPSHQRASPSFVWSQSLLHKIVKTHIPWFHVFAMLDVAKLASTGGWLRTTVFALVRHFLGLEAPARQLNFLEWLHQRVGCDNTSRSPALSAQCMLESTSASLVNR